MEFLINCHSMPDPGWRLFQYSIGLDKLTSFKCMNTHDSWKILTKYWEIALKSFKMGAILFIFISEMYNEALKKRNHILSQKSFGG